MKTKPKKSLIKTLFLRKRKKDESVFKYAMGIFHLWFGLLSSIIICIVCLTGCIYAFKNQFIELYNYDKVFTCKTYSSINIDDIHQHFILQEKEINSIFIPKNENRNWIISYTDRHKKLNTTYFNPYLKKELGAGDISLNDFFQSVLDLHRNLGLGNFGRQIVGASVIILIILLFSGFVLWLPKKLRLLKQNLTIKLDAKPQRLNYDLHRILGLYSLIPLLFISITGLYVTYPWVKNILITSLGGASIHQINATENNIEKDDDFAKLLEDMLSKQNEKIDNPQTSLSLSKILHITQQHLNYKGDMSITMPNDNNPRYHIIKINSENWLTALLPDEISIDKKGEVKSKELFLDKPINKQFTALAKPLHTGEIIGLPSIIFYFIISLIGFSLPITGFFIWWNRVKKQI